MMILRVTGAAINRLYERFAYMPGNAEYVGPGGKSFFTKALLDSILVVEYEFGIVRFTDYRYKEGVRVHGLFDSANLFRRFDDLLRLRYYVFKMLNVKWIECIVPSDSRALRRLLNRLGFVLHKEVKNASFNGTIYESASIYRTYREVSNG